MKRNIHIQIILSLFLIMCACNSNDSIDVEGKQSNTIQQSIVDTCCNYERQNIEVTTEGEQWLFSSIITKELTKDENSTVEEQKSLPYTIEGDWFKITKTTPKQFIIEIDENTSNKERYLQINLSDKNYYTYTKIIQYKK